MRECGALTDFDWVERDGSGRFPHRKECGVHRVCARCQRRRSKLLSEGVSAQRALALATHRARFNRHYPGREGRWTERLVTFTLRHSGDLGRDVETLVQAWRGIEAPWRRHLKARGADVPQVYVRTLEIANAGHAHLHVWMVGPYIEHALLRAWFGAALERAGYDVDRRSLDDVAREARDPRTREWLSRFDGAGVPWPVVDVRGGSGGAARYATKARLASYVVKGNETVRLEPVHAARVYEALEGVRSVQWARGWAPVKERSGRWHLQRVARVSAMEAPFFLTPGDNTSLVGHAHVSPEGLERRWPRKSDGSEGSSVAGPPPRE